jgi:hypothetical protein
MNFEAMEAAVQQSVDDLRKKLGENATVIIMAADEAGAWSARWRGSNTLVLNGLAHLGTTSIEDIILGKQKPKE